MTADRTNGASPADVDVERRRLLSQLTRDHLDALEPEVADALRRAAVVHTFDASVLKAILDGSVDPPAPEGSASHVEVLLRTLRMLPFVEQLALDKLAIHAATRSIILEQLWGEQRPWFVAVNDAAAKYFGRSLEAGEPIPLAEGVEYVYHQLMVDEADGFELAAELLDEAVEIAETGIGHALVAAVAEHNEAGRLSDVGRSYERLLRAELAHWLGNHEEVVELAAEVYRHPAKDLPAPAIARAARLTGRSEAAMASYEEALDWYQRAAELEPDDPTMIADHHHDVATVRHSQGLLAEATSAIQQAIETVVPTLLVPLRAGAFNETALVGEILVEDPETGAEQVVRYVPLGVFALNPDAWIKVDDAHFLAIDPGEPASDGGDEFWPVEVNAFLGALWRTLASVAYDADDFQLAEACARLGGQIAHDVDDRAGVLAAVELIYLVGGATGNLELGDAAVQELEDRVTDARASGDKAVECQALLLLGSVYADRPDNARAREAFSAAADAAAAIRDPYNRARALHGLAGVAAADKAHDEAERLYVEAIALVREESFRDEEARYLLDAGSLAFSRHRHAEAAELFGAALQRFRELESASGQFMALTRLADLASDRRRDFEAVARYEEADELAAKMGSPSQRVQALAGLGAVESQRGNHGAASEHLNHALALAREIGSRGQEAGLLLELATASEAQRDWSGAEQSLNQAREAYRALRRPVGELDVLARLVYLLATAGHVDRAIDVGSEALAFADGLGDRQQSRATRMNVALAYSDADRHDEAIELIEHVVAEDPEDPLGLLNRGWILYQADAFERSIPDSLRAFELDETQTMAIRNLGHANLAMGRLAEALRWYQVAIDRRHPGEDFVETIGVLERLTARHPEVAHAPELLEFFRGIDARLADGEAPVLAALFAVRSD